MDKELQKEFKKLSNKIFFVSDKNIVFIWGDDKGIPNDKIFIGRRGAPKPDYSLTPYEVKKVEYTAPSLFKAGILSLIGADGDVIVAFPFKDKANIKVAEKFNACLELYKQNNLGK